MPKKTMWFRLALDRDLSVCEILVDGVPEIPPRSRAYHLTPMNVGSPICEGLSSYFLRLSEAHCLTPRRFFEKGVNHVILVSNREARSGLVGPSDKGTWQINGRGLVAQKWVTALEFITLRQDLGALTFLPFREGITIRETCRRERAWCPLCLDDQDQSGGIVYEQLLWSQKHVTTCSIHNIRLQTRCPHCQRVSHPLSGSMRPGKCGACSGCLGLSSSADQKNLKATQGQLSNYEMFVTEEIGRLLALPPQKKQELDPEIPKHAIRKCAYRCVDGNMSALLKYFGLPMSSITLFEQDRRRRFIKFELVLRFAFIAGVRVFDLLTNPDSLLPFAEHLSHNPPQGLRSARRNRERVIESLQAAAKEIPPPSLREVANRLGYGVNGSKQLRLYAPKVCDLITKKFQESNGGKDIRRHTKIRLRSKDEIEIALNAALKQKSPPALSHVAKALGYATAMSISKRCPRLCQRLVRKNEVPRSKRRNAIEGALKRSLRRQLPEKLMTIAKRLGYQTEAPLKTNYPELSHEIRLRHEEHEKNQFLMRKRIELDRILSSMPPPSLKQALRSLGTSEGWLRKYFPDVRPLIVTRYLTHRREQSMANKTRDKERIKLIVREFSASGTFPSMNAVLDRFSASTLKRSEVWTIIREARDELG